MNSEIYNLENIIERFRNFQPEEILSENCKRKAAVAMLLKESQEKVQALFIERAADERDPWSGHIAFPGGKIEHGETSQQAAERETAEEIGLELESQQRIGQLSDIIGTNLPVQVSCHVYAVSGELDIKINNEVKDHFWVSFSDLYNQKRHCNKIVTFGASSFEVPAIQLPIMTKPVLWGITYRLVMQLHKILHAAGNMHCVSGNSRYTHGIEYI